MATSRLNSPGRGKGRRASNPEMGSRVPRRSGRGRRPSAPTEQNRASHSGLLAQEARLAFGLGWFGIGLGLAELLVPRRFARTIGVPYEHHRLIRAMGVREIANGLGILIWPSASAGIWVRVVGDMIDLACLGCTYPFPSFARCATIVLEGRSPRSLAYLSSNTSRRYRIKSARWCRSRIWMLSSPGRSNEYSSRSRSLW